MQPPAAGIIVVLGEALIDLAEQGDDEPRLALPGGSPYNVAIGLARLGRPTAFAGRLSTDPLGALLRRHAERSGVELSLAVQAVQPSTIAAVELDEGVARYTFHTEGTADFQWTDAELARIPDDAAAVHFGSLASWTPPGDAAIVRRVAALRERTLVSYDPNVRPALQPDRPAARRAIERTLSVVHLAKTSEEDLAWLYPDTPVEEVAQRWLRLGPTLVVVTRGAAGSNAYTRSAAAQRPAHPVEMVDTIGAGDAFTAGLLDALAGREVLGVAGSAALAELDTADLDALLDAAALVAALTCGRAGANPPRRAELAAARR
ncbi:MAG TPA: carbohydrate kinase [Jatrophihabitans sp.]|nr:carbohydrate kinase [Jatrophihabitans sp.]